MPDQMDVGPRPLRDYVMGSTGFLRGDRRWVYGSFVVVESAEEATADLWPNWCDGGWHFFGVEYDIAADTIGPLRRNDAVYAQ
jgi:hypothetical protein